MNTSGGIDRRKFLLLSGASMVAVTLSSCTVGGTTQPSGGKARTLHAAYTAPINSLDPYLAGTTVDPPSLMARGLIFDTLVRRDGDKYVGGLAKSWKQPDDTTWVFTLRDDVKFHDGSKLTSKDVKAVLDFMTTHPTEQSPLWAPIAGVEATSDHEVTIKTKAPMGSLLANLPLLFIAPAASVGDTSAFKKPVGSGSYTVDTFVPSNKLNLTRAKNYWGAAGKSPAIDLPYISETAAAITSLRKGDVDLLWPVPPDQVKEIEGISGIKLERVPSWAYFLNWFNCQRKPFTDPRVRQAMWYALDMKSIINSLYGKTAQLMKAPIPESVFGYEAQKPYDYDKDKARSLLKDAGLADGFSTTLMWFENSGPLATQLAQAMISGWAEIGVKVEPQSITLAAWTERLNKLDWDMELQINTVTTGDADFTLGRLYTSKANRMGYHNTTLDGVLANAAAQNAGSDGRRKLYGQACKIIWEDAVGIFPATIVSTYGVRSEVSGFTPAPNNGPDLAPVRVG